MFTIAEALALEGLCGALWLPISIVRGRSYSIIVEIDGLTTEDHA
jgi:hypothetical protein